MKKITIPSINSEQSSATITFHPKDYEILTWIADVECISPAFQGQMSASFENDEVKGFIEDLKKVEQERKGECNLSDEWGFALTLRSVDPLGHFVAEVSMSNHKEVAKNNANSLALVFEIEPSLLTKLVEEFSALYSKF